MDVRRRDFQLLRSDWQRFPLRNNIFFPRKINWNNCDWNIIQKTIEPAAVFFLQPLNNRWIPPNLTLLWSSEYVFHEKDQVTSPILMRRLKCAEIPMKSQMIVTTSGNYRSWWTVALATGSRPLAGRLSIASMTHARQCDFVTKVTARWLSLSSMSS